MLLLDDGPPALASTMGESGAAGCRCHCRRGLPYGSCRVDGPADLAPERGRRVELGSLDDMAAI